MPLGPILKKAVNALNCRATDALFGWRHKRRWLDTQGLGGMHGSYFTDYQDRRPVAEVIASLVAQEGLQSPSILEFGCSGGNNLKLLREEIDLPIRYCGLDIQEEAIAFAKREFPHDTFRVCSTEDLPTLSPQMTRADVFLVSGVFYYLPQKEAQQVLRFAAKNADFLVVCDILDQFNEQSGQNDGLFLHPFRKMCEEAGFLITMPPQSPDAGDRHGIFVAQADPARPR